MYLSYPVSKFLNTFLSTFRCILKYCRCNCALADTFLSDHYHTYGSACLHQKQNIHLMQHLTTQQQHTTGQHTTGQHNTVQHNTDSKIT